MSPQISGLPVKAAVIRYTGRVPDSLKRALVPYADRVDEVTKGSRKIGDDWTYCAYFREGWHDRDDGGYLSAFANTARQLVSAVKNAEYTDPASVEIKVDDEAQSS